VIVRHFNLTENT